MSQTTAATLRLTVRDPGDLIAAVPHLLGFSPDDSLVVVTARGRRRPRLGASARVDLQPPDHTDDLVWSLARTLARHRPSEVSLFVVGGGTATPAGPPRRDVADVADHAFAALRVPVRARAWAPLVTAGAPWRCYDPCGCSGVLPDPSASPVAAAAVLDGQVTFASRAGLERLVASDDDAALRRRAALLERAVDAALLDRELSGPQAPRRDLDSVTGALDEVASGRCVLGDSEVVRLAVALGDPLVRDACFAFAVGSRAAAAEQLWARLTCATPAPEVAEPAVLLAFSALLRGNGALAGAALGRARQACPGHRLTTLFDTALAEGVRPGQLQTWVLAAASQARQRLDGPP